MPGNRQTLHMSMVCALALAMPVAIDVPTDSDSSYGGITRLRVSGGVGQYAIIARDCEGNVISKRPVGFQNLAGGIEHRLDRSPVWLGVRGGMLKDKIEGTGFTYENTYVNPYVNFDWTYVGLGAGVIARDKPFVRNGDSWLDTSEGGSDYSGNVRLGREDRAYVKLQVMESMPLYSDGGYVTVGFGARMGDSPLSLYFGAGAEPYDELGAVFRANYTINPSYRIHASGVVGDSEAGEYGIGLGLEYTMHHGN